MGSKIEAESCNSSFCFYSSEILAFFSGLKIFTAEGMPVNARTMVRVFCRSVDELCGLGCIYICDTQAFHRTIALVLEKKKVKRIFS